MDEQAIIENMGDEFSKHKGLIGPTSVEGHPWLAAKREALAALLQQLHHTPAVLEVGIGDLSLWGPDGPPPLWLGLEGTPVIAASARARGYDVADWRVSSVAGLAAPDPSAFDLVVCLDVLYHQPDLLIQKALWAWLFRSRYAVLASFAQSSTREPGQGHTWFPWRPDGPPAGWRRIASAQWSDGLHPQELGAYLREDV